MINPRWMAVAALSLLLCTGGSLAADATAANTAEGDRLAKQLLRAGYMQGKVVDSVPDYRVDGWNYVDSRHLTIPTGASEAVLLTLMMDCYELDGAESIGFTSTADRLTNHDEVLVRQPGGGAPRRCPIDSINELSRVPKTVK